MAPAHFDAVVIGAGQAGPSLAARCGEAGMRVALVERHLLGGTCVNTGCYPTKTLVASARAMHLARRGAEFGFEAGSVRAHMRRVKQRKDEIVGAARGNVEGWVRGMKGVERIDGHARFVAPRTVQVGDRLLTAQNVFLNVGSRASRPPLEGIDSVLTLDNVSMLELEEVPSHLVIVGGSYIGLEFAQVMRRFGADVTVVDRSRRFLPREVEDIAAEVQAILEGESIRFRLGASAWHSSAARAAASGCAWTASMTSPSSREAMCSWPWGAYPIRKTSAWSLPGSARMRSAMSKWTLSMDKISRREPARRFNIGEMVAA